MYLLTFLLSCTYYTEKLNTTIVTPKNNEGLLTSEAVMAIKQAQQEHQHFLRIPRRFAYLDKDIYFFNAQTLQRCMVVVVSFYCRPEWDENMTAEELDQIEKESFLQWRRQLAQ